MDFFCSIVRLKHHLLYQFIVRVHYFLYEGYDFIFFVGTHLHTRFLN